MADSLKHLALGDLEHELTGTRRLLERVPDEHLSWRPHPRSFTLGELAGHLANLPRWFEMTATGDEVDLEAQPPRAGAPDGREALLARWDEAAGAALEAFRALGDEALAEPWTLRNGGEVVFTMPRAAALRTFVLSHLCHHRGQLTVYLRLKDVPLPPLYGPTADEAPEW